MVRGDESRLDRFARDLKRVCDIPGEPTAEEIKASDDVFASCFPRVYIMHFPDERTCITVKMRLSSLGINNPSDALALKVLYLFKFYSKDPHFDLDIERHRKLVDDCEIRDTTFNVEHLLLTNDMSSWNGKEASFENVQEFMLFASRHKDISIKWAPSDEYKNIFDMTQKLLDGGMYICAINRLQELFKYNPLSINGRIELVNAYLGINKCDPAEKLLLDMADYIKTKDLAAFFYRRLGYIYIERREPELALACLYISIDYLDTESARNEIEYVEKTFNVTVPDNDAEYIVVENNIPIIDI